MSKRDVASEIDYSDHRSIATSVTQSNRIGRARASDTHSVLSKANLDKLDKNAADAKIIRKYWAMNSCRFFMYNLSRY